MNRAALRRLTQPGSKPTFSRDNPSEGLVTCMTVNNVVVIVRKKLENCKVFGSHLIVRKRNRNRKCSRGKGIKSGSYVGDSISKYSRHYAGVGRK